MTRLTLEWHLRGIVAGTVEPECVRVDLDDYSEYSERWWPGKRYYADPHVEDNDEQRSQAGAGSYTTGFDQMSGAFCDAYSESMARQALNSSDPVAYLDAVAHDPAKPMDWRFDAAELLSHHIVPLSDKPDGDLKFPETYWSPAKCPECLNEETLFDVDRPDAPCRCTVCDRPMPQPEYPA